MARLIDSEKMASAIKDYFHGCIDTYNGKDLNPVDTAVDVVGLVDMVANAYPVDAVPVVRCKDCIHFREDGYCNVLMGYCGDEDWFCASGRRKDRR